MITPFFLYQPTKLSQIIGQREAIEKLTAHLQQFRKGKGIFLYGPTGTGKTSSVIAFAKEHNWEVLELNASDTRNQKDLLTFLQKATQQQSLFFEKKLILLDEIDGLSGTKDRGAITAISKTIKNSPFPIVMTGEQVFDKKFSTLKKESHLIAFQKLTTQAITEGLQKACEREGVALNKEVLTSIARNANGDFRAALNDLFTYFVSEREDTTVAIRKRTEEIQNALIRVFKTTKASISLGAYDFVQEDLDKIFLWVDQNIPLEYSKKEDLALAYNTLSRADIFFSRIRRWQYYRFYAYCYLLLSVGIALSKKEKYTSLPRYTQPTRLLSYWRANMTYAKRKTIIEKITALSRQSKKDCLKRSYYDLLPALASQKALQEELALTSDEIIWLKKQV